MRDSLFIPGQRVQVKTDYGGPLASKKGEFLYTGTADGHPRLPLAVLKMDDPIVPGHYHLSISVQSIEPAVA